MVDTPDFAAVAMRLVRLLIDERNPLWATSVEDVRRELVTLWNARGAADVATVEFHIMDRLPPAIAGIYVKSLEREVRKLDG